MLVRTLSLAAVLLCLAPRAKGDGTGFGFPGLLYETPGNVTLRTMFGEIDNGGYFGLDLQPQALGWDGPKLKVGEQSRPFLLRVGGYLVSDKFFGLGVGFVVEGLKTGLDLSLPTGGAKESGMWHGAAGAEVSAVVMFGKDGPLLMLFAGKELAPEDQSRTFGEAQLYVPVAKKGVGIALAAGIVLSSFTLRGQALSTHLVTVGASFPLPM